MKIKIYIGCSLTQASPEFRESIFDLGDSLDNTFEVLKYLSWRVAPGEKSHDADGLSIYEYDMKQVETCDIFVPIVDLPSIGLGMEFAKAFEKGKIIRAFVKRGTRYSSIISSGLESNGQLPVQEYDTFDDVIEALKKEFL